MEDEPTEKVEPADLEEEAGYTAAVLMDFLERFHSETAVDALVCAISSDEAMQSDRVRNLVERMGEKMQVENCTAVCAN